MSIYIMLQLIVNMVIILYVLLIVNVNRNKINVTISNLQCCDI